MNWLRETLSFLVFLRQAFSLDQLRVKAGPRRAIEFARRLGNSARSRDPRQRDILRRLIGIVDRRWKTGPNCYRRVLFEIAMDREAAAEVVQLGFQQSGDVGSGHAWLGAGIARDDGNRVYDAIVSI